MIPEPCVIQLATWAYGIRGTQEQSHIEWLPAGSFTPHHDSAAILNVFHLQSISAELKQMKCMSSVHWELHGQIRKLTNKFLSNTF